MKQADNKETKGGPAQFLRTASFWALIVLIPLAIFQVMDTSRQVEKDLTYSEFRAQLAADNVVRITITEGVKVEGELRRALQESGVDIDQFKTLLPTEASQDLLDQLEAKGVEVEAKEPAANWVNYLISVLPWILIIGLWFFFFRQMQAGGSRAFSFGKSKAKLLTGDTPKVTFADVAGADEAKEDLKEIIEFLKDPAKFRRLGGRLAEGGAAGRAAGHRKDPACAGRGRRGRPTVLLHVRIRFRGDVRRRRSQPCAGPVRTGQSARAVHHLHR